MKIPILLVLVLTPITFVCSQQSPVKRISVSAHTLFQSFNVPPADASTYFRNIGGSLAGHYNISPKGTTQQTLEIGYLHNRYHGNTIIIQTHFTYNPVHSEHLETGLSIGAGYMNMGLNNGGWEQDSDGNWTNLSNRKGCIFIPVQLHVAPKVYENDLFRLAPVMAFEVNALLNYSHASSVLPQSIIKLGLNVKLKRS